MSQNAITKIVLAMIFVALVGGIAIFAFTRNYLESRKIPPGAQAKLESFSVEKPDFVARGTYLGRVEIWGVPEGKESAVNEHVRLGTASKGGPHEDEEGVETWRLPIPLKPMRIVNVYAKAFDRKGDPAGIQLLPYEGVTGVQNALWIESDSFILKVGEDHTTNALTIKLLNVKEDSRCSASVQCVWQGRVVADIELKSGDKTYKTDISTEANETVYEGYTIRLMEVAPAPAEPGKKIPESEYQITFVIGV